MSSQMVIPAFAGSLFIGMLLCIEIGRRIGRPQMGVEAGEERAGLGLIEAAIFTLLGLLLAFTLTGAASRFDARRMLIVDEANAIGAAYLRVDLLSAGCQPAIRELFREYLDSRMEVYRKLPDIQAAESEISRSKSLQGEIWSRAVAGTQLKDSHIDAARLLLPALNQMIDITTTRTMAARAHPPWVVFWVLFGLGLLCALLAGHAMAAGKRRSWLHTIVFVLSIVIAVYVILEIEYPRVGLIRLSGFDSVLIDLRASMK